jgi:hypothetical protein
VVHTSLPRFSLPLSLSFLAWFWFGLEQLVARTGLLMIFFATDFLLVARQQIEHVGV